jgi:hypothetical protein
MQDQLSTPPAELDGARVERYASLRGIAHLARVTAFMDGVPAQQPEAIAVAVYPGESDAYVFHCSAAWSVLAAGQHASLEAAVRAAESGFPGIAQRWVSPGQGPQHAG